MNRSEKTQTPLAANRRGFLGTTIGTAAAASVMVHSSLPACEEQQLIRVGVVGCGGRGTGAIGDSLNINENIKWVAAADVDTEAPKSKSEALKRRHPEKVDLDEKKIYGGLDGYKRILEDRDIDLVIMTTPPGFRPRYVLEAVEAGKHVFAEKPTCVDAAGYKICLKAHELAIQKGTGIVTEGGDQDVRRHAGQGGHELRGLTGDLPAKPFPQRRERAVQEVGRREQEHDGEDEPLHPRRVAPRHPVRVGSSKASREGR